jgi:hypothetical protein
MTVLQLLDEVPVGVEPTLAEGWRLRIQGSLEDTPGDWTSAVARIGELSDEHAWSLLSWIELSATQVVRDRSRSTLATAAFAMALVLQSRLDRRDCSLVGSLLRRGAELAGLDFGGAVIDGCDRAGTMGEEAQTLLLGAPSSTPATHVESGAGATFRFARRPPDFDVDDLERWLEG